MSNSTAQTALEQLIEEHELALWQLYVRALAGDAHVPDEIRRLAPVVLAIAAIDRGSGRENLRSAGEVARVLRARPWDDASTTSAADRIRRAFPDDR